MLRNLHISHYALIETLEIDFSEGFSVITGETGAGKSIILGALGLLLGNRADAKSIKSGASKCVVEALFEIDGLDLQSFFEENDIDFDGKECIVRREVYATGKSRAFVNDTPVSLTKLKEVTSKIVDIHSQHQNLLMGREQFLLGTLDAVAEHDDLLGKYVQIYTRWTQGSRELEQLKQQSEKDKTDTDYLQFQLSQLDEAALVDGEQEELEQEQETLSHAEEIKEALYRVSAILSADEQNPLSVLKASSQTLDAVAGVFPLAQSLSQRMDSVRIELEDVSDELERALDKVDFDPARLEFVEDRLSTIYSLQKKHAVSSVSELLAVAESLRDKLDKIENIDSYIARKQQEVAKMREELQRVGEQLTTGRTQIAKSMEKELIGSLQNLGMPNVALVLEITSRSQPDASGMDNVRLLFSANKNVPMQEVSEIASGGEIARLMLALKALISRSKNLPTVIFDEIDTGVSGTMAEKMAIIMQEMSKNCQVLCITHLPQIAALGVYHYRVFKSETASGVASHIRMLDTEERIHEIANMLSGADMTEAAINNAKSLLKIN